MPFFFFSAKYSSHPQSPRTRTGHTLTHDLTCAQSITMARSAYSRVLVVRRELTGRATLPATFTGDAERTSAVVRVL